MRTIMRMYLQLCHTRPNQPFRHRLLAEVDRGSRRAPFRVRPHDSSRPVPARVDGDARGAIRGRRLLWPAWKCNPKPRGGLIAGGWALLLAAAVLLAPWAGGDRGVAISTLLVTVAATIFIAVSGR